LERAQAGDPYVVAYLDESLELALMTSIATVGDALADIPQEAQRERLERLRDERVPKATAEAIAGFTERLETDTADAWRLMAIEGVQAEPRADAIDALFNARRHQRPSSVLSV
jgi:hypothetical protein